MEDVPSAQIKDIPRRIINIEQHTIQVYTTTKSMNKKWTVPQLSIMIIYNSTRSILIQWIRDILSGDNLT